MITPKRLDSAALIAGALFPLAFAPLSWYPVAPFSLAVLFFVWRRSGPGRATWRGWLWGVGCFGVGVSWVVESFQFAHVAWPVAVVLTVIFVAFLALFPATLGWFLCRFPVRNAWIHWSVVGPSAWIGIEVLRGSVLSGFTWLRLGFAQLDSPLAGFIPILGVYGTGWLGALIACLFAGTALREVKPAWPVVIAVCIMLAGGGLHGIQWTQPIGTRTVALIQGNFSQDIKWAREYRRPTLRRYRDLTIQHLDKDLVVWPETALPGFIDEFGAYLAELDRQARQHGTSILLGAVVFDREMGKYYNSVIGVGLADGRYDKSHLAPFGEYLPIPFVLGPVVEMLRIPMSNFTRGRSFSNLRAAGIDIGVSICYEVTFGHELARALPDAKMFVNVTNDAWFGDSLAPFQHLEMVRFRALETGRAIARAANTGISALIDPGGRITARSRQFVSTAVTGSLQLRQGLTPYSKLGDPPILGAVGVLFALGLLFRRRE